LKYTMTDTIKKIEHKAAKRWLRGTGPEAKFVDDSQGYWAVFTSCPASIFLGAEAPGLKAGDQVRLTLEKV
jgi:hypothetical protein